MAEQQLELLQKRHSNGYSNKHLYNNRELQVRNQHLSCSFDFRDKIV
jgi:hypothetical protein